MATRLLGHAAPRHGGGHGGQSEAWRLNPGRALPGQPDDPAPHCRGAVRDRGQQAPKLGVSPHRSKERVDLCVPVVEPASGRGGSKVMQGGGSVAEGCADWRSGFRLRERSGPCRGSESSPAASGRPHRGDPRTARTPSRSRDDGRSIHARWAFRASLPPADSRAGADDRAGRRDGTGPSSGTKGPRLEDVPVGADVSTVKVFVGRAHGPGPSRRDCLDVGAADRLAEPAQLTHIG